MIQVVSVRDIYRSSIDASFKNPQQRRLLRFGLTDGICEAVAIEFSPIPFITEEIAPGTKVSSLWSASASNSCCRVAHFVPIMCTEFKLVCLFGYEHIKLKRSVILFIWLLGI